MVGAKKSNFLKSLAQILGDGSSDDDILEKREESSVS
jgi:hypothetical protein